MKMWVNVDITLLYEQIQQRRNYCGLTSVWELDLHKEYPVLTKKSHIGIARSFLVSCGLHTEDEVRSMTVDRLNIEMIRFIIDEIEYIECYGSLDDPDVRKQIRNGETDSLLYKRAGRITYRLSRI